jgi:YbbR domain-containing protein
LLRRWFDDLGMILLALVLAIVVWIVATQEENPIVQDVFKEAISVQARGQQPGTTFLPTTFDESVQVTIRAPQTSWRDLRVDEFSAWVDLADKAPGDYEVPVGVTCADADVRIIQVRPATVAVHLKEEISLTVPVQVQIYGSAAVGYVMQTEEAVIEPPTVTVAGPAQIVEQITKATVDLSVRDLKETFTGSRRLVARQANGDLSGFVTIEPASVQITIPVVQQTGFKEVTVRASLTGTVSAGYWVRGVSVDPVTVMLGGDPAVVAEIGSIVDTEPLDVTGATGDVVERMPLDLPEGASPVGVQGVKVTVSIAAQQSSVSVQRRPVIRGLSTDLVATVTPDQVDVTLVGPLPRLNALTDQDLIVYVELVDKGIGSYQVDLTPLVPEGLEVVSISPASVSVDISPIPVSTPTAMPTRTPTPTPSPTPDLTATATAGSSTPSPTAWPTVAGTPPGPAPTSTRRPIHLPTDVPID